MWAVYGKFQLFFFLVNYNVYFRYVVGKVLILQAYKINYGI